MQCYSLNTYDATHNKRFLHFWMIERVMLSWSICCLFFFFLSLIYNHIVNSINSQNCYLFVGDHQWWCNIQERALAQRVLHLHTLPDKSGRCTFHQSRRQALLRWLFWRTFRQTLLQVNVLTSFEFFAVFMYVVSGRCNKPITGIGGTKFISFEDRHWHNDCFYCASCRTSLVGRGFITDQDDIICPECAKQKLM